MLVVLPEGHWRQESEPAESWYLERGQSVHKPELFPSKYLPVGQAVQSDMSVVPVALVVLPEGHWRQESEPAESWYLERGQSMHPTAAQSLKPMLVTLPSEWKANDVTLPEVGNDAGKAVASEALPQYLAPPSTCK